ncbi:MAG: DUF2066 domain-containing protein [Gammaproteobacteria bacterium]|nr:DUF2066 domain-containing protein [Gammaproteobacteria bacterium]
MKNIILLALVGVIGISAASAVEVTSLYTAQVAINEKKPDPRADAYDRALAQVLLRVSGAELVNDVVLFDTIFPDPSAYVVQFRPGPDETLFVSFDGKAIEAALRRAGQRVWGGDRPLTLVWLAVDWGGGSREILAAADEDDRRSQSRSINRNRLLRARMLEIADRRGLPIAFPLMDGEDRAAVSFSDISGGFDDRVLAASERYDVNSVLIGRVRASGSSQNRWSYHFGSDQRAWSGEPEVVISRISDLLAAEFAIGGNEPVRTVQLNVSGVTSVEAYAEVQSMLAEMNVIDNFAITEVAGDRISFRVNAHGGASRLARALRFEGLIEQERIDMSDFDDMGDFDIDERLTSLDFFFNP